MTNYILTRYHPTRTKNSQPQKTISFKKAAVMNLGTCLDCYFSKKSKKKKITRYHSPITGLWQIVFS